MLLTGSGNNFSAGQDVKDFLQAERLSFRQHLLKTYNPLIVQMRKLKKPILAAINGAAEFDFSNEPINASQVLSWGLVNRVVPAEELETRSMEWALKLAQGPTHAMGLAKRDFNRAVLGNLEQVLDYEAHIQEVAGKGDEHKEGVKAFLEKRQAVYVK